MPHGLHTSQAWVFDCDKVSQGELVPCSVCINRATTGIISPCFLLNAGNGRQPPACTHLEFHARGPKALEELPPAWQSVCADAGFRNQWQLSVFVKRPESNQQLCCRQQQSRSCSRCFECQDAASCDEDMAAAHLRSHICSWIYTNSPWPGSPASA
jgi:hypothetical protein